MVPPPPWVDTPAHPCKGEATPPSVPLPLPPILQLGSRDPQGPQGMALGTPLKPVVACPPLPPCLPWAVVVSLVVGRGGRDLGLVLPTRAALPLSLLSVVVV